MAPYNSTGSVDCTTSFETANLNGKTAIVTGGANGLGEAYVRELVAAGVFVGVGDLDTEAGKSLELEFPQSIKYVRCDTTKWEHQVELFRATAASSPSGKVHYVVANAGVARKDDVFLYSDGGEEPRKPDLSIIDINVSAVLYTTHLALHYFVSQNGQQTHSGQEDTALTLIGSGAAFLDCLRGPQYSASKWAMRGIMHSMRRTTHYYGSRINVISPWYVRTKILNEAAFKKVTDAGVQFAESKDAAQCLLRILSDTSINGRSFFISGRKWAPQSGYVDLDIDDYNDNLLIQEIQIDQMAAEPASLGLFLT